MEKSTKKGIPERWTTKILTPKKIGPTPPMNREGYWKKREPEGFKVNE